MSINAYLKILNRLHKGKDIEILAKRIVKAGPSGLSREEITKLAKLLPPLPWPQGIHKEVASKMGLSNTKVSRAISEILEDEELIAIVNANSRIEQKQIANKIYEMSVIKLCYRINRRLPCF